MIILVFKRYKLLIINFSKKITFLFSSDMDWFEWDYGIFYLFRDYFLQKNE